MVYRIDVKTETKGKQSQRCNICFQIIRFTCKATFTMKVRGIRISVG